VGDKGVGGDGNKGLPGNKGPAGDKGPPGNKGPTGDKGPTGNKGLPGDKGPGGSGGPPGNKGPTGNKGSPGDPGSSPFNQSLNTYNSVTFADVCISSDVRLKNIVGKIENALAKVNTLDPIYYTRKDDEYNEKKIGLIAQEVQEILPEVVQRDSDGFLTVAYPRLVSILIGAVKELSEEVDKLKGK
jgi:hypothetical protein